MIAECKSYHKIDKEGIARIKDSLDKNVQAAILIDAQVVVLGVVTNSSNLSELFATVAEVANRAKDKKIGVHLAINGKLHLWGSVTGTEPHKASLEELQVDNPPPQEEWSLGESPTQYGGFIRGSRESFNNEVLRRWQEEMGIGRR
ncbi:hypothetical protein H6F78_18120 [Coleofasciculus sp. FACHB-64]|uniref:hypothetical protein n=1 Tax=Cyanophyceae TaxID=3028117 RepID=UPI001682E83A|nr:MULTISPECIES: hypothetical protein [unclassified Coleofasciculus]MBD1841024.1 hypothetical protein [Coleofasciculus sp. FACHB-501]MBD2047487.1 hypothetical protein [Coleofasciculus sp. FACHB-64]